MVRLYIRDNLSGHIHEYGTNQHDSLEVSTDGSLHYVNMQNMTGTKYPAEGYTFVLKNGDDPREIAGQECIIDVGGSMTASQRRQIERLKKKMIRRLKLKKIWEDFENEN